MSSEIPPPPPRRKGFAGMDPDKVREIARKGGKAAHAQGRAREFTQDEARAAGRKGGLSTQAKRAAERDRTSN